MNEISLRIVDAIRLLAAMNRPLQRAFMGFAPGRRLALQMGRLHLK